MIRKWLLALGFMAVATTAQASTYQIAFTQNGLGDAGPDWFGTFEIGEFVTDYNDQYYPYLFPGSYSQVAQVTAFSAVINGITYNLDPYDWHPTYSVFYGFDGLYTNRAPVMEPPFAAGVLMTGIWWVAADNACGGTDEFPSSGGCGWLETPEGSFTISPPAAVPIPAALPLLATALVGFGWWFRRRPTSC